MSAVASDGASCPVCPIIAGQTRYDNTCDRPTHGQAPDGGASTVSVQGSQIVSVISAMTTDRVAGSPDRILVEMSETERNQPGRGLKLHRFTASLHRLRDFASSVFIAGER